MCQIKMNNCSCQHPQARTKVLFYAGWISDEKLDESRCPFNCSNTCVLHCITPGRDIDTFSGEEIHRILPLRFCWCSSLLEALERLEKGDIRLPVQLHLAYSPPIESLPERLRTPIESEDAYRQCIVSALEVSPTTEVMISEVQIQI